VTNANVGGLVLPSSRAKREKKPCWEKRKKKKVGGKRNSESMKTDSLEELVTALSQAEAWSTISVRTTEPKVFRTREDRTPTTK